MGGGSKENKNCGEGGCLVICLSLMEIYQFQRERENDKAFLVTNINVGQRSVHRMVGAKCLKRERERWKTNINKIRNYIKKRINDKMPAESFHLWQNNLLKGVSNFSCNGTIHICLKQTAFNESLNDPKQWEKVNF